MSQKSKFRFFVWLDEKRLNKDKKISRLIGGLPDWVTPNKVTILRALFLVIWLPFLIADPVWLQVVIFYVPFFLLDWIDGTVARIRQLSTRLGSYFDFVIDRVGLAMAIFVILNYIYLRVLVIWLIMEICMAVILLIDYFKKKPWIGQKNFLAVYWPPLLAVCVLFVIEFVLCVV